MPTPDEWLKQPLRERLQRMALTPDEIAAAIRGQSDAELSRRPGARNWAAKESTPAQASPATTTTIWPSANAPSKGGRERP